jgi:hypothetical protein
LRGQPHQASGNYEALRANFFEGLPSAEVARRFGYTPHAFRVLCYDFRRDQLSDFFVVKRPFVLSPGEFTTRVGGLFLFIPDLVRLNFDALAQSAKLPGSRMIPAEHALRSSLALKLWSIERKSHSWHW